MAGTGHREAFESEQDLVEELLEFNIYGEVTTLDGIVEAATNNLNETKARVEELHMTEAEDDETFESEEELVKQLLKFNIYGEVTTLDGIVEAAKKNLNETKARASRVEEVPMTEAEDDETFHSEEELVKQLQKFKIYGEATTLDGIVEAAKNSLNETNARVEELHMTEAEDDETFDSEEELVKQLQKINIYGEATTLEGIAEAAKKKLNETKARAEEFKVLFGVEQKEGKNNTLT